MASGDLAAALQPGDSVRLHLKTKKEVVSTPQRGPGKQGRSAVVVAEEAQMAATQGDPGGVLFLHFRN